MDVDFVYPGNAVERIGLWCRLEVDDLDNPVLCIENNNRARQCEDGFDPIDFRREMILPKDGETYGTGLSQKAWYAQEEFLKKCPGWKYADIPIFFWDNYQYSADT